jgi:hypothetical protein
MKPWGGDRPSKIPPATRQAQASKEFIAYLASPRSPAIAKTRLEPIVQPQ